MSKNTKVILGVLILVVGHLIVLSGVQASNMKATDPEFAVAVIAALAIMGISFRIIVANLFGADEHRHDKGKRFLEKSRRRRKGLPVYELESPDAGVTWYLISDRGLRLKTLDFSGLGGGQYLRRFDLSQATYEKLRQFVEVKRGGIAIPISMFNMVDWNKQLFEAGIDMGWDDIIEDLVRKGFGR